MQTFFPVTSTFTTPFFVGTVVDNNDPTFNYRVKVKIPEIHANIEDQYLPWAAKVDSSFLGMDGSEVQHSVPEVGSKVLTMVLGDDANSLLYLGTLYKNTSISPTGGDYLGSYGIYRADGQFIGVDKINSIFKMIFEGDINIDRVINASANISGNVTANVGNSITINSGSSNTFKAGSSTTIDTPATSMTGTLDVTGNITGQAKATAELHSTHGSTTVFVDTFLGTSGSLVIQDGIVVGAGSGGGDGGGEGGGDSGGGGGSSGEAIKQSLLTAEGMNTNIWLKSNYNTYRVDGNTYYYFTYQLMGNKNNQEKEIEKIVVENGIITDVKFKN